VLRGRKKRKQFETIFFLQQPTYALTFILRPTSLGENHLNVKIKENNEEKKNKDTLDQQD
jgi:hypothetical protein